jgi:hypothetical protein
VPGQTDKKHWRREMRLRNSVVSLETWTLIEKPLPFVVWHELWSVNTCTGNVFRPSDDLILILHVDYKVWG